MTSRPAARGILDLRSWPPLAAVVGLSAIVTTLIVLIAVFAPVDASTLWGDVAKTALSVVSVAIIGGLVKFLFDQHVAQRDARNAEAAYVSRVGMDIEDIRSTVGRARQLIKAHRSARSYRDRMQELIDCRVRIASLVRSIEGHWADQRSAAYALDAKTVILRYLEGLRSYLNSLIDEYERLYKPVSDQQRMDEALAEAMIKEFVSRASAGDTVADRPALQWTAWFMLDSDHFPELQDLLTAGPDSRYQSQVVTGCQEVMRAINVLLSSTRGLS